MFSQKRYMWIIPLATVWFAVYHLITFHMHHQPSRQQRITDNTIFNHSLSTPIAHHNYPIISPLWFLWLVESATILQNIRNYHPPTKYNMPEDQNLLQNCYKHLAYNNHQVRNLISFMLTTPKFITTISFSNCNGYPVNCHWTGLVTATQQWQTTAVYIWLSSNWLDATLT